MALKRTLSSFFARPAAVVRGSRLLGACLLGAWLGAFGCGGSGGPAPPPGGMAGPKVYWKIDLVTRDAAQPNPISTDIDRLFDDGRILVKRATGNGRDVALRSPEGTWRTLAPPAADATSTFGYLTYYEDDQNFGGVSSTGGYVVVGGTLAKCSEKIGGFCEPRGKLLDGSILVVTTNEQGNSYLQSWKIGQNDALDVGDIFYQANLANGNAAGFARLASDESILMLPFQPGGSLSGVINRTIVILKDRKPVLLDSTQFNHGEPVDPDVEAALGQPIAGLTRSGVILGRKNRRPVLKDGDTYQVLSDEPGEPIVANTVGDVIYRLDDGGVRYRWQGQTYLLDQADFEAVAGSLGDPLHLDLVDINASGQVLLWGVDADGASGRRLYLATPSKTPVPPHLFAHLAFTAVSGGAPPAAIDVTASSAVAGSLSDAALSLNVTTGSATPGKSRAFNVVITRSSGKIAPSTPLPVTTTVTAEGTQVASVTYADAPRAALAASGSLTVTELAADHFTVTVDKVLMKEASSGDSYTVDGYVEVAR